MTIFTAKSFMVTERVGTSGIQQLGNPNAVNGASAFRRRDWRTRRAPPGEAARGRVPDVERQASGASQARYQPQP